MHLNFWSHPGSFVRCQCDHNKCCELHSRCSQKPRARTFCRLPVSPLISYPCVSRFPGHRGTPFQSRFRSLHYPLPPSVRIPVSHVPGSHVVPFTPRARAAPRVARVSVPFAAHYSSPPPAHQPPAPLTARGRSLLGGGGEGPGLAGVGVPLQHRRALLAEPLERAQLARHREPGP